MGPGKINDCGMSNVGVYGGETTAAANQFDYRTALAFANMSNAGIPIDYLYYIFPANGTQLKVFIQFGGGSQANYFFVECG